jgi:hypothetical protein
MLKKKQVQKVIGSMDFNFDHETRDTLRSPETFSGLRHRTQEPPLKKRTGDKECRAFDIGSTGGGSGIFRE